MKLPARGERATPFFRMRPSWTGVMEMEEAPRSTTRAEDLPAAKLEGVSGGVHEGEIGLTR